MRALVDAYVPEKKYRFDDAVTEKLKEHGGDRRSETTKATGTKDQDYNVMLKPKQQGNSAPYLLARLKRDHPKIAEKYADGQFPSVRAAAIEAKLVKQTITVPVDTPEHALKPLIKIFGVAKLRKALDSETQEEP